MLSGGNFHAEPVAFAADTLALAIAEIGSLSERRMAVLVDPKMSGLPRVPGREQRREFRLHDRAGHRRGAGVGEQGASPLPAASIPSPPPPIRRTTSAWPRTRARRLARMVDNAAAVIGIELLAAAQGIDFHRPAQSSRSAREARTAAIRGDVPFYAADRYFSPDILARTRLGQIRALLAAGEAAAAIAGRCAMSAVSQPIYDFVGGDGPLLISFPHSGTSCRPGSRRASNPTYSICPIPIGIVPQLYDFFRGLGASIIHATHTRYVVDLNRRPTARRCIQANARPRVCPTETFDGEGLYLPGAGPTRAEIGARLQTYWRPYHDKLARFRGILPSDTDTAFCGMRIRFAPACPACSRGGSRTSMWAPPTAAVVRPLLSDRIVAALSAQSQFSFVLNGRFKGGYITRHYGHPAGASMPCRWRSPKARISPSRARRHSMLRARSRSLRC